MRNRDCKIFIDDSLVVQKTLDAPFRIINAINITSWSFKSVIDYIRLQDTAGNFLFNEEFDGCESLSVPKNKCKSNCELNFENYFNKRFHEGEYSYGLIDSIYNANANRPLNVCNTGSECDTLRKIVWDYQRNKLGYRENSCDSSKWAVNYGFSFNPITAFSNAMNGGVVHLPFDSTLSSGYTTFDYRDSTLCPGDKFSVEVRVKNPNPAGIDALHWGFIYRESPIKNISAVFYKPNPDPWGGYFYIDGGTQVFAPNHGKDISDWRRIKIAKDGPVYQVYMDDTLLSSVTTTHTGIVSLPRISMLFNGRDGYLDWVKIYDSTNTVRYFEDFEDCNNFSKPASEITCPGKDCRSSFTDYYNSVRQSSFNESQIDSIYSACGINLNVCDTVVQDFSDLLLCGNSAPVVPPVDINTITNCSDSSFFIYSVATELNRVYTDSLMGEFDSHYREKCIDAYKMESFTVSHEVSEYHYTLYYYDQAGNLVKTIPPKGVAPNRNTTWLDEIKSKRALKQTQVPEHSLVTDYRYNALNQVVAQQTPDAGLSEFWYDRLGRLSLSQNARQKAVSGTAANRLYSYTNYDYLGRITEVGQIKDNSGSTAVDDALTRNPSSLETWFNNRLSYKGQITNTIYDEPYSAFPAVDSRIIVQQRNLRNRVSYTTFVDTSSGTAFNQATFY
ncbi:MAG: hypothetical protein J7497_13435, partial [Chitinophagaceae bacterium]|nr:hypothetical protein [Chitinophagaceae bacterium]